MEYTSGYLMREIGKEQDGWNEDMQTAIAVLENEDLFNFVYENIDDAVRYAQDEGAEALNVLFASIATYESEALGNGATRWGDRDFPHIITDHLDDGVYYMIRPSSGGCGLTAPIVFFDVTNRIEGPCSFYSAYGCECFTLMAEVIAQEYEQAGFEVAPANSLGGTYKRENAIVSMLSHIVPSMNVGSFETNMGDYGMGFTIFF